ncbi:UNVERIFIED_CONTAM: stan [Trichonephila clavipes]
MYIFSRIFIRFEIAMGYNTVVFDFTHMSILLVSNFNFFYFEVVLAYRVVSKGVFGTKISRFKTYRMNHKYECDTEVNLCYSSPCLHGGSCVRREGGFSCICPPGHTGECLPIFFQFLLLVHNLPRSCFNF